MRSSPRTVTQLSEGPTVSKEGTAKEAATSCLRGFPDPMTEDSPTDTISWS